MGTLNCKNCNTEKEDKSLEITGEINKRENINDIGKDFPHDSDVKQKSNKQINNQENQSQKEEIEEKIENEKKDQVDAEKREEVNEEGEEDIMNAFGKTVIQTIYNKENNNNNQDANNINNNLNNYDESAKYINTASKEGAKDISNIQIINSAESNQYFTNIQQEYFTNNPPDNMNLNNNLPSSIFIDNNPYNQYSQNVDLTNFNAQSYRIIQNGENGENLLNDEQNELGTQNAPILNLNNNISQYNLGNSSQNGNEYINSNIGNEQIINNQIYYSNDIYNQSSVTFGNQLEISNNNNNF